MHALERSGEKHSVVGRGHHIHLQQAQTEDAAEGQLLLGRHVQVQDDPYREGVGDQVRDDVQRRIGEVEDIDRHAATGDASIPGPGNGMALESRSQDKGGCLAAHNAHHNERQACELLVS